MSSALARGLPGTNCLLDKLLKRNLIANIYPESQEYRAKLKSMLSSQRTVYAGFDATSDSLHIGNLATIMNLLHFQQYGHKVICLIGDATTKIGDPSGHVKDRLKLDNDLIEENAKCLEKTLVKIFKNHSQYFSKDGQHRHKPIIIRNSTWYRDKSVVDFVGDVFREVRVGWMLHKKSVQDRLKAGGVGMNMSEFCYQIFQAYDWLQLRRNYDCRLQIGGSDQAGNIYTGHDVIRKITNQTDSIGLLAPLLTDSSGKKLGKSTSDSVNNAIWLNHQKTSPYQLYQYFCRTPDKDVEKFLKVFSLFDENSIEAMIFDNLKKSEDAWFCQKKLAESVCLLVHGEAGLSSAKRITHAFFQRDPLDIANLNDEELDQLFDSDSIITLIHKDSLRVSDLVKKTNCVKNELDVERLISAGAVWLNGARVTSINVPLTDDLILGNGLTIMRIGKKNYFLFKWRR